MEQVKNRLANLSPERRTLFTRKLKERQVTGSVTPAACSDPSDQLSAHSWLELEEPEPLEKSQAVKMKFSFLFFGGDGSDHRRNKYDLLLRVADFADKNRFEAIWLPERHFHAFGGLYPDPSVLAGALAVLTSHIELRAGSVVLPLHNPVEIVERWSIVDNLSQGRVGISLASGWHRDDFILAPDRYHQRKEITWKGIEQLRQLWRGDAVSCPGVDGHSTPICTYPRPLNLQVPLWITSAGNLETFQKAGELQTHLLTGLTGQSVSDLAGKIAAYRAALATGGLDPRSRKVALMLHTYVGENLDQVRDLVRQPMCEYLKTNLSLHENLARSRKMNISRETLNSADERTVLEFAFQRYFSGSALFGTVESCMRMIHRLSEIGVDEVACLIDFGLPDDAIFQGFKCLQLLKQMCC